MGVIELFILAVGLSMDAFAVSVCKGLAMKKAPAKAMVVCGAWFGGFQALMPLIGYYLGTLFIDAISAIDHWIAFALLALIGINMLREALSKDEDGETPDADLSVKTMFIMAVATSIDALAVGGRNYIFNSGSEVAKSSAQIARYALSEPMVAGEQYTVSLTLTPMEEYADLTVRTSEGDTIAFGNQK